MVWTQAEQNAADFEYDKDDVDDLSNDELRRLYSHYQSQGELNEHPELAARHDFVYHGEAPDVGTYNYGRNEDPNTKWDKKAGDGYEVDPTELRTLASNLESDLNLLERHLNTIKQHSKFTPEGAGGGTNGSKWSQLANQSSAGFGEYFGAIQTGLKGVISNLRITADNYEAGEDKSHDAAGNVPI